MHQPGRFFTNDSGKLRNLMSPHRNPPALESMPKALKKTQRAFLQFDHRAMGKTRGIFQAPRDNKIAK
jgi:hypothetical protein